MKTVGKTILGIVFGVIGAGALFYLFVLVTAWI